MHTNSESNNTSNREKETDMSITLAETTIEIDRAAVQKVDPYSIMEIGGVYEVTTEGPVKFRGTFVHRYQTEDQGFVIALQEEGENEPEEIFFSRVISYKRISRSD